MKTIKLTTNTIIQVPTVPRYIRNQRGEIFDTTDFTKEELKEIASAWTEKFIARGK